MNTSQTSFSFHVGNIQAVRSTVIYLYFRYYETIGTEEKRQIKKIPTSYSCHPSEWNSKKSELKTEAPGSHKINADLARMKSELKSLWAELATNKKDISTDQLLIEVTNIVKGIKIKDTKKEFANAFESFIDNLQSNSKANGQMRSPSTMKKYDNLKRLLDFYSYHSGASLSFENIDQNFYDGFTKYLMNEEHAVPVGIDKSKRGKKKMDTASVGKIQKFLKQFLRHSHLSGVTECEFYEAFKVQHGQPKNKISLEFDELELIEKVDLIDESKLDEARDIFLFACYTGQRISDIQGLKREDIDGIFWRFTEQKQGIPRVVVLIPEALNILKKYKNKILPLPTMPDQIVNNKIKEVARKAKINTIIKQTSKKSGKLESTSTLKADMITTKAGRKTFTTLSEFLNIPKDIIKMQLGHSTNDVFSRYSNTQIETMAEAIYDGWNNKQTRIAKSKKWLSGLAAAM